METKETKSGKYKVEWGCDNQNSKEQKYESETAKIIEFYRNDPRALEPKIMIVKGAIKEEEGDKAGALELYKKAAEYTVEKTGLNKDTAEVVSFAFELMAGPALSTEYDGKKKIAGKDDITLQ